MLIISSTFTIDPLRKSLETFLEKFTLLKNNGIEFSAYNQAFQELDNNYSITAQNTNGINIFIIRLDDFLRFQKNVINQLDAFNIVEREVTRFTQSLKLRAQSMDSTSFIVMFCHNTDLMMYKFTFGNRFEQYDKIMNDFKSKVADISNIHLIFEQDIAQIFPVGDHYDPVTDAEGHIPFSLEYYNILGYLLVRRIFDITLLAHTPLKAIILDCDNTLWKGICGEVGADNVEVSSSYRFLQQFMKDQKNHGVLLCLCSKNNEKDVLDVFKCSKHNMPLEIGDIAAYRINWNTKSHNIGELLSFLSFSERNVVFIDDREDECREVQQKFPNLLTIQLPDEKNIPLFLKNLWFFDHIKQITNEDKNRTAVYQKKFYSTLTTKADNNLLFNQVVSNVIVNLVELKACDVEPSVIQRAADLTSRTNQFNLAKRVYSEAQIKSFVERKNAYVWLAEVKDNYGNEYGLTGLVIFNIADKTLVVDTFLLSCRIIGKNVERVMLDKLVEMAKQNRLTAISLPFIATDRNNPAENFLKSIVNLAKKVESLDLDTENPKVSYLLEISQDTLVSYSTPVLEVSEPSKIESITVFDSHSAAILDIAKNHETYLNVSKSKRAPIRDNNLVSNLLNMLNKICRKKIPSVDADFVASGVDSFELMMFLAQVYRSFGVKINLSELQELDNVIKIAKVVSQIKTTIVKDNSQTTVVPTKQLSLSAAQEALWLERLKIQDDSLYNLFRVFSLKGELDIPKLEKVFRFIITKHKSLRTAFWVQANSILPICKIIDPKDINFKLRIKKLGDDDLDGISSIVHSLVRRPFDLKAPPLMRIHLLTTASDECYLLIVLHHIICDGWSFSKLIQEINDAYNCKSNELGDTACGVTQHCDFTKWQHEQVIKFGNTTPEFWQKHFSNYPVMNLPYDFRKPKTYFNQGQSIFFELDPELTDKLHQISAKCKTTLYETMLSVYMIFLSKLCGQTDIALASVVATGPQECFNTIGYMVNLLTIRYELSSNPAFLSFLKQIKLYFQKVLNGSNLPFIELVKSYRDYFEDITDFTRVFFVFENFPSYELSLQGIQSHENYYGNYLTLSLPSTSKFDLAFYFKEIVGAPKNSIHGVVEFNTNLFKLETVQIFIERFKQLLNSIVENINQPILSYQILTSKERATLITWNKNANRNFPPAQNVLSLFLSQVSRDSRKVALVEEDGRTITYGDLNKETDIRASHLQGLGVSKGDIVAVTLERSIDMIANLLAIVKLGATYLAIDPTYPLERRKYLCENAGVKVHVDYSLNISQYKIDSDFINTSIEAKDIFYITYTSGSTGKPKGVPTTHIAFYNLLYWFQRHYNLSPKVNTALVVSEGFDAFGWQLWPYLACGATVYIVSKQTFLDAEKFIEFINNHGISICFIPTAYIEILINEGHLDRIKTLKYLLTGGDKLNTFLSKRYPFKIINHYGITECAVVSTVYEVPFIKPKVLEKLPYNKPLIGKPIDNTEIYIVDSNGLPTPIGTWGELWIGGIGVTSGYLHDSTLSSQKFIKSNFSKSVLYRTGDKVRFLHDGNIEYLGRLDNQIEIYGHRVEPAEIESVILENTQVKQAVAILHDDGNSKQLIAYITVKNDVTTLIDTSVLVDALRKQLPLKMVPKHIVVLDKLPVTENGKFDIANLAKKPVLILQGSANRNEGDKLYGGILDMFSNILNEPREKLNIDKSFFDLGGDSIGVLKLLNIIKLEFGVSIPISEVYSHNSSISSLASTVLRRQLQKDIKDKSYRTLCSMNNIGDVLVTLRSGRDDRMPLFFTHLAGGTVFSYQKLVDFLDEGQTCYGIQYPLESQHRVTLPKSIQELATFYIDIIRSVQPKGPYAFVGHSFGGMLSYEVACQLYNSGEEIALIGVLDTWVVSMLDIQKRQKLKRYIIQDYENYYESAFTENPMVETIFIHMQNIGFVYKPPCFKGTVDLFKAIESAPELAGIQDETNFWSKFATVNIHNIPGDHNTMLELGYVQQLAEEITKCISSKKVKKG